MVHYKLHVHKYRKRTIEQAVLIDKMSRHTRDVDLIAEAAGVSLSTVLYRLLPSRNGLSMKEYIQEHRDAWNRYMREYKRERITMTTHKDGTLIYIYT